MKIEDQIIDTLERVRPWLKRDGGDIEFVRFNDGIVYVRMLGACIDCSISNEHLKEGVEAILIEEVPGIISVVDLNDK